MTTLTPQPWMTAEETERVMAALTADGKPARFVGGCVRDALIGKPVLDIDIATPEVPEKVIELLESAEIKAIPTGLKHGTITAVCNHKPYEITTLRKDIETDGRHATVAFTDAWQEDAARRDFTMNALYLDPDGAIHDYFDGQTDLKNRHVRFIGDADQRITEDVLRILRFFRFNAWYGRSYDAAGLAACKRHAASIVTLSGERVQQEMFKLLRAPDPVPALHAMQETEVLEKVIPNVETFDRLAHLVEVEDLSGADHHPILHIASLLKREDAQTAATIADHWRLSNADTKLLRQLVSPPVAIDIDAGKYTHLRHIRRIGKDLYADLVLLTWAETQEADDKRFLKLLANIREWRIPAFPVTGDDLIALGVAPGPGLGRQLKALENKWEDSQYKLKKKALLAEVKTD